MLDRQALGQDEFEDELVLVPSTDLSAQGRFNLVVLAQVELAGQCKIKLALDLDVVFILLYFQ
jgi:hypothetical protein